MLVRREPTPEELEPFFGLNDAEIVQLVLLLLIEENAQHQLRAVLSGLTQRPVKPAA
jgi:hypothetical protein